MLVRLADEITKAQTEIRLQVLSKVDELQQNETILCNLAGITPVRSHAAQYLDMLKHFHMWPSLYVFDTASPSDLVSVIKALSRAPIPGCLRYGLSKCPLGTALKELSRTVCTIRDSMEGVPLSMVVGGNDENGDGSSDDSTESVFPGDD
jgi:hypothetical protein